MRTTRDFIDLARSHGGLPSDYAVAKQIGISRQLVSQLRSERIPMSVEVAEKLAPLCGVDAGVIYAEAKACGAKRTEVRRFWERVAKGLAAAFVLGAVGLGATWSPSAEAASSASLSIHYANLARWLSALRRRLIAWRDNCYLGFELVGPATCG